MWPIAVVFLTAALLLASFGVAPAEARRGARCEDPGRRPAAATIHYLRSSMLCLVNRVREHRDLRPLSYNADLRNSASGHSSDMVVNHYFSHYGLHGSTVVSRIARSGYLARVSSYFTGENIGGGAGSRFGSPIAVFRQWMRSPPHRANILDRDFHDFGVGVARGFPGGGSAGAVTYTLDLGTRERP